jgi:DNA polymerase I-like protein with 3'-5' exonuclease and polymerase domains
VPRLREFRWDSWAKWTKEQVDQDRPDIIAVDTETMGVGFYDEPFAATLTWRSYDGSLKSGYIDLEAPGREGRIEYLQGILKYPRAWVMHNSKFDLQKLRLIGAITDEMLQEVELHDTQTLYVLLDENGRKGLKHLAVHVLGVDNTIEVEIKSGPNKGKTKRVPKEEHQLAAVRRKLKLKKEDGYHLLPRDVLIPYALKDTEFTLQLYEVLLPRLEALNDPRLLELYREFMELKLVLLDMESDGFALDLPYLKEVTSEYGVKVMEGWDKIVTLTGKPELNPQSPAQLIKAFEDYAHIGIESTAEAALAEMIEFQAPGHDLAKALLQYRSDKKIHTTYLTAMLAEHRDGIIHPNFNDDAARTGRMSSSAASNN